MATQNKALFLRANWELATNYLHYWLGQAKAYSQQFGVSAADLDSGQATRANLTAQIPQFDPSLVVIGGHGAADRVAGQNNEIVYDSANIGLGTGRVMFIFSCLTGQQLCPQAVANGARAAIGWDEEFIWVVTGSPSSDEAAASCFISGAAGVIALLGGHTVGDAKTNMTSTFDAKIAEWQTRNVGYAPDVIATLLHNRDSLVVFGDSGATVSDAGAGPLVLPAGGTGGDAGGLLLLVALLGAVAFLLMSQKK